MPTRAKHHDFEPSEQFGLRYSATGKLVKISDPEARGKEAITYTNCLDIFDLAEALDISLTEEQAQEEAEYIYENRRQFYKNHPYMEKKAIAKCYDGPVFPEDVVYRRSNCEKYTVLPDGSIVNASGRDKVKTPNWEGFVHTAPKKHEKVATFTKGMPRKTNDKSPAITLPKQDNPLVKGEYKTRTPEEASRSAVKQREQARKEAAKTTEEEKQIVREHYLAELTDDDLLIELDRRGVSRLALADNEDLYKEIDRRGIVVHLTLENASDLELAKEMESRDGLFHRLIPAALRAVTDQELAEEIRRRNLYLTTLDGITDKELADKLRSRGYTVTATKTVEI